MLVRVKAYPGSRKECVEKTEEHAYSMYVREPAVRNMANTRIRALVAQQYHVSISQVRMHSGARSRSKTFVVE